MNETTDAIANEIELDLLRAEVTQQRALIEAIRNRLMVKELEVVDLIAQLHLLQQHHQAEVAHVNTGEAAGAESPGRTKEE